MATGAPKLPGPCVVFSEDRHLRDPGFAPGLAEGCEIRGPSVKQQVAIVPARQLEPFQYQRYRWAVMARTALRPPKPKELVRAARMGIE